VQVLGAEAEEVARLELHTLPDADEGYVGALRALLVKKVPAERKEEGRLEGESNGTSEEQGTEITTTRRPGVCILLSWKKPWEFLDRLRRWLQLLAQALLEPGTVATDPMDILKDAQLAVTVAVQHTEAQEALFREGYKEEDFDYISQCLRTAILPLHPQSSLVYTSSTTPPQQPGNSLSEVQKVLYTCLDLDLSALTPKLPRSSDSAKKEEFGPKHEFMDRIAIVSLPAGTAPPSYAH
jgi:dynein light intermediate chain 1